MPDAPLQEITVASASFPTLAAPQVDLEFTPDEYLFSVTSDSPADAVIHLSTDGVADHYRLEAGTTLSTISVRRKTRQVWARKVAGAGVTKFWVMASTDV